MQHMVIYCEHVGGGFWAEPLNVLSNLAFFLSAYFSWRLLRLPQSTVSPAGRRWDVWLLILSIVLVGIAGLLWHPMAVPWAGRLDVIAMLVFINLFLMVFLSRRAGFGTWGLLVALMLFQAAIMMLSGRYPPNVLNGALFYLPAVIAFWMLALWSLRSRAVATWPMAGGAALFSMSLGLHSVDLAWCLAWPRGTHFLWHLANAGAFYLLMRGLLLRPLNMEADQTV